MLPAPPDRPARHTLLRSFAGEIAADAETVYHCLLRRLAPIDQPAIIFASRSAERLIVVQGGWWYRGEWRVLPVEDGSRIEYELLNVAQSMHWAGPLAGRSVIAGAPASFQALLSDLVEELETAG